VVTVATALARTIEAEEVVEVVVSAQRLTTTACRAWSMSDRDAVVSETLARQTEYGRNCETWASWSTTTCSHGGAPGAWTARFQLLGPLASSVAMAIGTAANAAR